MNIQTCPTCGQSYRPRGKDPLALQREAHPEVTDDPPRTHELRGDEGWKKQDFSKNNAKDLIE